MSIMIKAGFIHFYSLYIVGLEFLGAIPWPTRLPVSQGSKFGRSLLEALPHPPQLLQALHRIPRARGRP